MTKVRVWTKQEDEIVLKFYKEKSLKSISGMIDCFHEFTETEIISPLWMHEG